MEALVAEAPDYKDAASRLQAARKQGQVADLYTQAKKLHQAGQWQAVIHIFGRIAELSPDYLDTEELLSSARHEFEYQKHLAVTKGRYQQALQAMNSGRWQEARSSFAQIQEEEVGFEDTERLLARVEAEIAKQEAQRRVQEQVGILHEQAINLSRARQWRQALAKVKEIETLDPEFADPDGIAARAEAEIAREEGEAQRQRELAALYAEAVRLLKAGQYQEALEKWGEVQAINPDYFDRHEVQMTARNKLAERTKLRTGKPHLSTRNVVILGLLGLVFATTFIVLNRFGEPSVTYPLIYDNFDSPRDDGDFDTSNWKVESLPITRAEIAQENGVLNITLEEGEVWLRAINFTIPPKAYYIEVDIMLDSATRSGSMNVGIKTSHNTDIWCGIGHYGAGPWRSCLFEKWGEKAQSLFSGISALIQKTYHFRFDIDTTEKRINILLDGQRVREYPLAEDEKITGFTLWGHTEDGPVKGHFDNVKIGLIDK